MGAIDVEQAGLLIPVLLGVGTRRKSSRPQEGRR